MAIVQSAQSAVGSVKSGRTYLDTLANKYVLGPANVKGIGGFVFDYASDTNIQLQAEITDNYTEDNSAIHDHIAIKPVRITLSGYVGELILEAPTQGLLGLVSNISSKLGRVNAYLQDYTPGMVQKLQAAATAANSAINAFDQGLSRVENIVGFFSKAAPAKTKQQKAWQFLSTLAKTKQIFWLETPYESFDSMAIEIITARQDEKTNLVSEFTVTLKQLRFARVETTKFDNNLMGRAAQQKQAPVDAGKTPGKDKPVSWLRSMFN